MNYDEMNRKEKQQPIEKTAGRDTVPASDVPRMFRSEAPSVSIVRKQKRDNRKMER